MKKRTILTTVLVLVVGLTLLVGAACSNNGASGTASDDSASPTSPEPTNPQNFSAAEICLTLDEARTISDNCVLDAELGDFDLQTVYYGVAASSQSRVIDDYSRSFRFPVPKSVDSWQILTCVVLILDDESAAQDVVSKAHQYIISSDTDCGGLDVGDEALVGRVAPGYAVIIGVVRVGSVVIIADYAWECEPVEAALLIMVNRIGS